MRSNVSKYRTCVSQLIVAQAQEEKGILDGFFLPQIFSNPRFECDTSNGLHTECHPHKCLI